MLSRLRIVKAVDRDLFLLLFFLSGLFFSSRVNIVRILFGIFVLHRIDRLIFLWQNCGFRLLILVLLNFHFDYNCVSCFRPFRRFGEPGSRNHQRQDHAKRHYDRKFLFAV